MGRILHLENAEAEPDQRSIKMICINEKVFFPEKHILRQKRNLEDKIISAVIITCIIGFLCSYIRS